MSSRARLVLAGIGALALAAVVAGVAVLLTRGGSGAALRAPTDVAPAVKRFPAPPAGSFVVARQDVSDVLALAVLRRSGGVRLQISDVTENGVGATGLRVSFAVRTAGHVVRKDAAACGAGCYRADVALGSAPRRVDVRVARSARTTRWNVTLPQPWPAQDATAIVTRAERVWRGLRSLRYREHLSSDLTHTLISTWQIVAPDRLAYQIEGDGGAVIVGLHRWDRQAGGPWVRTSALRLQQPAPFWVEAVDAHVLGTATVGGHPVWRVSFFDPRTPGWFEAAIERKTYRTLDVRMTAVAHFMHDTYGSFNTSIKIDPPTTG